MYQEWGKNHRVVAQLVAANSIDFNFKLQLEKATLEKLTFMRLGRHATPLIPQPGAYSPQGNVCSGFDAIVHI